MVLQEMELVVLVVVQQVLRLQMLDMVVLEKQVK
jgi:hypothetical protein